VRVLQWLVRAVWMVVVCVVLAWIVTGCVGPEPTVSPIATPTLAPSPLVIRAVEEKTTGEEVSEMPGDVPGIGGFETVFLVMGIAALVKALGLRGKALLVVAVFLGVAINGVALAVAGEMLPAAAAMWVLLAVRAIGYTLAIPGLYDLLKDEMLPAVGRHMVR
jgi:hypothetical protein